MKVIVVWCKWSSLFRGYRLHYKRCKNREKAIEFARKIKMDSRKFIWSYIVDGKERDNL